MSGRALRTVKRYCELPCNPYPISCRATYRNKRLRRPQQRRLDKVQPIIPPEQLPADQETRGVEDAAGEGVFGVVAQGLADGGGGAAVEELGFGEADAVEGPLEDAAIEEVLVV